MNEESETDQINIYIVLNNLMSTFMSLAEKMRSELSVDQT